MDARQVIFQQRLESVRAQSRMPLPNVIGRLLDLLQAIAVTHKATILTMDRLLDKLVPDLPGIDRDEIRRQCLIPDTAIELHAGRHVGFFTGFDNRVRLIDGSVPESQAQAQAFLAASAQVAGCVCAFCLLDDGPELRKVGDRRWIHPHCHGFYLTWYRAAVRQKVKKAAWEVLGLPSPNEARGAVERAYRRKSQRMHPDKGGSNEAMSELNVARDEALNSEAARTS